MIINQLNQVIAEFDLLQHPFYQAWSKGELNIKILQNYAKRYYLQVKTFPRFISAIHTRCPEIEARKALLHNLVEEELHGKDHPELWVQFAEGLGVKRENMQDEGVLPETQAMVDKFFELAARDWRDGLCALYAYESQVPAVSASKIAGLKQFYNIQDEYSLEFFVAHQAYDVEHSAQVAALIEKYAEPEQAKRATREAAQSLWGFLDGMCRVEKIACH